MIEFFQTMMGKKYYEHDIPKIAKQLQRIADALEKQNQLKEKEMSSNEKK